MSTTSKFPVRAQGLDSIRFICAFIVFFGHGGAPLIPFPRGSLFELGFRAIYGNIWVGPAAVIVFFIISGFCIHFPYCDKNKELSIKEFYTKRLLRLLVPVCIAIPLSSWAGENLKVLELGILWSLIAELIYYLIYPLLRFARRILRSWSPFVAVSFGIGLLVAFTNTNAIAYPSFGPGLNWLLGLPCWLLGCWLAEKFCNNEAPRPLRLSNIWVLRLSVLGAAMACMFLSKHTPVGYPWTLNIFAFFAVFWLHHEIWYRKEVPVIRMFEWAGGWSYSLYLIHPAMNTLFLAIFGTSWHLVVE
jgi:peptidoglycan/LPS O-acetylase OafA/YrhL